MYDQAPSPRPLLFHFLARLPEEEIGTDRRPQNGHERRPGGGAAGPAGQESVVRDLGPVRMDQERGNDIGEQGDGEPLEDAGELVVPQPHSRTANPKAKKPYVEARRSRT